MPATSRKRNKGKERKAKRQAKKEEKERADANRLWRSGCRSNTGCNHGFDVDVVISDDHPVSTFMDQYHINFQYKRMSISQNLREIFKSHRYIWNNESYRKLTIDILVRIGTNLLLDRKQIDNSWPVCIAQSIVALEHYNGTDDIDLVLNKRLVVSKWRDLAPSISSGRRDNLKFFRKRLSCSCLKEKHLEARKNEHKTGVCYRCKVIKERVVLSVCSRCMIEQYCSRECQLADWPEHKSSCDIYVRANQNESENTNQAAAADTVGGVPLATLLDAFDYMSTLTLPDGDLGKT